MRHSASMRPWNGASSLSHDLQKYREVLLLSSLLYLLIIEVEWRIYVYEIWSTIGSDNDLSVPHQAIILTNADLLLIGSLGTNSHAFLINATIAMQEDIS